MNGHEKTSSREETDLIFRRERYNWFTVKYEGSLGIIYEGVDKKGPS